MPEIRHVQTTHAIETRGIGLYGFGGSVDRWLGEIGARTGMATVFCRHTSASLTIQENADPDVLHDLAEFFARLVPEDAPWFRHREEGPDDMPGHVRAALTDVSLSIPVNDGTLCLGTWQEIYLFEHRRAPHRRNLVLHYAGY